MHKAHITTGIQSDQPKPIRTDILAHPENI